MLVNSLSSVQATGEKAIGETCFNQHTTQQADSAVLGHVKSVQDISNKHKLEGTYESFSKYEVTSAKVFGKHIFTGYEDLRFWNDSSKKWELYSAGTTIDVGGIAQWSIGSNKHEPYGHVKTISDNFYIRDVDPDKYAENKMVMIPTDGGLVPSAHALRRTLNSYDMFLNGIVQNISDLDDTLKTKTQHGTANTLGIVKLNDSWIGGTLDAHGASTGTAASCYAVCGAYSDLLNHINSNINILTNRLNGIQSNANTYDTATGRFIDGSTFNGDNMVGMARGLGLTKKGMIGRAIIRVENGPDITVADLVHGGLCNTVWNGNHTADGDLSFQYIVPTNNIDGGAKDATVALGAPGSKFMDIWVNQVHYKKLKEVSDKNLKKDIEPLDERWLKFFSLLKPVSYRYTDDDSKINLGFIAQDVEAALLECGMTVEDFSLISRTMMTKETDKGKIVLKGDKNNYPETFLSLGTNQFISVIVLMEQNTRKELEKTQEELSSMKKELEAIKRALNLQ